RASSTSSIAASSSGTSSRSSGCATRASTSSSEAIPRTRRRSVRCFQPVHFFSAALRRLLVEAIHQLVLGLDQRFQTLLPQAAVLHERRVGRAAVRTGLGERKLGFHDLEITLAGSQFE